MPANTDQPGLPPLVYADLEHDNQPICLDCFQRLKNEANAAEPEKWSKTQEAARAVWDVLPAHIRQQKSCEDPNGWVKLLLDVCKWPRIEGRCWACCQRLALNYLALAEEMKGAKPAQDYCARCQEAAVEANTLALALAASGYLPTIPILDPDPKYGHLPQLANSHAASLARLLVEPNSFIAKTFHKIRFSGHLSGSPSSSPEMKLERFEIHSG